ncbi:hypothetical protein HYC85_028183 [Camellia sinensis]|uniref:Uncharacterized protein n=1 Tax=Camellia sinensis TaxID=4442 RepID=A0A7J7FUK5_CAMSI|nr:hypothetical protein HYC85_028183 [Camellia sinensis]
MECGSFELHQSLTGNGHTLPDNPHNFSLSKPWPILPSYLTWSLNPNVPFRSCESYFGNGFTRRIDLLKSSLSHHRTGGWFRSSNCEKLSDPDQHLEHSYLTMNQNPKDPESPTFETFMKLIRRLTHYPKSLYTK